MARKSQEQRINLLCQCLEQFAIRVAALADLISDESPEIRQEFLEIGDFARTLQDSRNVEVILGQLEDEEQPQ